MSTGSRDHPSPFPGARTAGKPDSRFCWSRSSRRWRKFTLTYPSEVDWLLCAEGYTGRTRLVDGVSISTSPPHFSSSRLTDARLTGRADSLMRAHECRSLRHHVHLLRKGLLPPGVETVGGGIQTRVRLSVVQPFARSEELTALWVKLLVRIHFALFPSVNN